MSTEDVRLKNLFDYTKFHIGIYISLTTAILAAIKFGEPGQENSLLLIPVILLTLAGMFGGIVGSNIPEYREYDEFKRAEYGRVKFDTWIGLEHKAFWAGVVALIIIVIAASATDAPEKEVVIKSSHVEVNVSRQ